MTAGTVAPSHPGTATSDHHGSHRRLLWAADGSLSPQMGNVDAIFVPTTRPVVWLKEAAAAAVSLGCPLVTLHSKKWTSAHAATEYFAGSVDLIAIDLPDPAQLRLPELETSRVLADTMFEQRSDLSTKRNLALVLSRMLGWERVVFLDDDIQVPDPDELREAVGLLDTHAAVGLGIGGFPDNSVVCHAYRAVGGEQDTFIGGGALAVAVTRNRSFFPKIYNDDWFYLLNGGKRLQSVATVGQVIQQPYDPYRTTDRARAEELGDVLAEGIFWLLDQGKTASDGDLAHWRNFLEQRRKFTEQILRLVERSATIESGERARMVEALKAALGRRACITPERCVAYLQAWVADQERWQRHIQRVQRQPELERALRSLARKGAPQLTWFTNEGCSVPQSLAGRPSRSYQPLVPLIGPRSRQQPDGFAGVSRFAVNDQDPRQILARRLRALRVFHWPGRKVKQSELAEALSGDGRRPASVPLISSWESPNNPKVPPAYRVEDIATFFASPRSLDGRVSRLLSIDEMTTPERVARERLLDELTCLRREALDALRVSLLPSGTPGAVQEIDQSLSVVPYRFQPGQRITIVCTQLPQDTLPRMPYVDPMDPDFVELHRYSDPDSLLELFGHLRAANPVNRVEFRAADQLSRDDYTGHLVLLGGVDWNDATSSVLERLQLPVRQIGNWRQPEGAYFEVPDAAGCPVIHRPWLGEVDGRKILREDVALFARAVSPFNRKRLVTICNGMYGRGTYGAVRALTDECFRDRNAEYLREAFGDSDAFCILSRVTVENGMPLTPDWTRPETRLFEWSRPK